MMIGGDDDVMRHLDPIFDTLAPGVGTIPRTPNRMEWARIRAGKRYTSPPVRAFRQMVHNGIEYG